MDHQVLIIDVPEHATAEEAARALKSAGDAYILVQVLPVPGVHRAYFRAASTRRARSGTESTAAFARMTATIRAAFQPFEVVTYQMSLGPESTFYRWKQWALAERILVKRKGRVYLAPVGFKAAEN